MNLPSGDAFSPYDLELLKLMAKFGFIKYSQQPFKLKSGILSNVYVFGREDLTDNPELEWKIGHKIARMIIAFRINERGSEHSRQPCLIGIPTAGTPLAQAASMVSYSWGQTSLLISHRIMREALKQHGAHQTWVNGKPDPKHRYWLVDNVATNGQSKLEAREKLQQDGYPVEDVPVLIFINRQQGAVERLKREGFNKIVVVYNLLDIAFCLGELGLWPKSVVDSVEKEIKEHQFISS